MMNRAIAGLCLAMVTLSITGCAAQERLANPYDSDAPLPRDPLRARELTQEAVALMGVDDLEAERLLRRALAADLYHGPAHNNLGVLHLKNGQLYEAAHEFEWSRKLMPGHPDPRLNLALTLERAGRYEEAIATYRTALDVYKEHLPTIQALARLQLKIAKTDDDTLELLQEIALRSEEPTWRHWAREQIIALDVE